MSRLFPALTATKVQATAYLLGVALFSISFLVFLNASISFVVTDVIGRQNGVGDVVGTLGFADELLALVACPLWGILSDRIGVRNVAVIGYLIVGVSLMLLVQAQNVYPELLIGRLGFSIGGAACSTMVTAILPSMTLERNGQAEAEGQHETRDNTGTGAEQSESESTQSTANNLRHSGTFSISSELTITPARYVTLPRNARRPSSKLGPGATASGDDNAQPGVSQLAGYVGMFTGIGALLAVAVFLPLPARIAGNGTSQADAVKDSFYIVGSLALVVAVFVYLGLRGLPGEEGKGFRSLFITTTAREQKHNQRDDGSVEGDKPQTPSYLQLVLSAVTLAFTDSRIGLGYLGGLVARASSVGISLFIPLFVNAYFIREGLCTNDPSEDIKSNCRRAYTLASMLTGFSQLAALLCAPLFGWFNGYMSRRPNLEYLPLALGTLAGMVGCIAFGLLDNPDPFSTDRSGRWAILAVVLMGISQIAAIVCSLGVLARGIRSSSATAKPPSSKPRSLTVGTLRGVTEDTAPVEASEDAPLLPVQDNTLTNSFQIDRTQLKGSIAGVYSLAGGAGILLLTKLGGFLFDKKSSGAPFYMLAGFNGLLLFAVTTVTIVQCLRRQYQNKDPDDS
ncbi:hypothetical protein MBLNU459_g4880t1 [Dothideomycetes sp. NU459]